MRDKKVKKAVKKIDKDIKEINKKIREQEGISKIEKNYQMKKEIKKYYQQNQYKISDDILVAMYDECYQPSVMGELSIGVFSGMIGTVVMEYIFKSLPEFEKNLFNTIVQFTVGAILFFAGVLICGWLLFAAYKQICAFYSFSEEVNDFYKSYLKELIEERESKLNREAADERRNKKKNRKHK